MKLPKIALWHVLIVNVLVGVCFWTFYGLLVFSETNRQSEAYRSFMQPRWSYYRHELLSPPVLVLGLTIVGLTIWLTARMPAKPNKALHELIRLVGFFLAVNYLNFLLMLSYFKP